MVDRPTFHVVKQYERWVKKQGVNCFHGLADTSILNVCKGM